MIEIRKVHSGEVREALDLAWEVFLQFEAPDYKPEGVSQFKQDIIENDRFITKARQGVCPIYAAFDRGKIIGVLGMRPSKTHINLLFTKKAYHRQGVASALFRYAFADLLRENPSLGEITVNASPYGKPFYLHLGFVPLSGEQETDGIRFIPMKYTV